MEQNYGHLEIRLNELMQQKKLSKNKLSHKAEMNWKQIDNYCTNNITRLDTYVLCKLCTVLECEIQDLLVFHPSEPEPNTPPQADRCPTYSTMKQRDI